MNSITMPIAIAYIEIIRVSKGGMKGHPYALIEPPIIFQIEPQ